MIITNQQINSLGASSKEEFVQKTIVFLKENTPYWASNRTEEEIREHVVRMIEEGRQVEVKKEINIQKLLYNWIRYDLMLPFSEKVDGILRQSAEHEDDRLHTLIKNIRKNNVR